MRIVILLNILVVLIMSQHEERTRVKLQYDNVFSEQSQVTAVFISCEKPSKLKLALRSFLFFNTHQLRKLIIVYCTKKNFQIVDAMPYNYERYPNFIELRFREDEKSMLQTLDQIYKTIKTNYVYQSDGQWETVKGYGFIEQSIKLLQQGQINKKLYSQVISSFPLIRNISYLGQMEWSKDGIGFHEIHPFTSNSYEYFTFSPSVFNFKNIFVNKLLNSLVRLGTQKSCSKESLGDFDKCCIWAIGQYLNVKGYHQIYLNDGKDTSNTILISN